MAFKFNFPAPDSHVSDVEQDQSEESSEGRIHLLEGKEPVNSGGETTGTEVTVTPLHLQEPVNSGGETTGIEVTVTPLHLQMIKDPCTKLQRVPTSKVVLSHLSACNIESLLKEHGRDKKITSVLNSHSDLVSGVYEGGLKVWECALDLVEFLSTENVVENGMKILELGCGAGLPGIFAFLKGATVHFQDFNYEVLDLLTIPNVLMNSQPVESMVSTRCRFIAGDWTAVGKFLTEILDIKNDRYDIILTSETIYNIDNQPKLLHLMKSTLKPTGTIYLAAKTHYFGLGGGTRQFEELVRIDGTFDIKVRQVVSKGLQREILQMNFRA